MAMNPVEGELLPPIPMNIMDIAIARVNRAIGSDATSGQAPEGSRQTVRSAPPSPRQAAVQPPQKPTFFKDALGNEYRLKDGKLYVKAWTDANFKFRILNAATGKEISADNKKVQVYGWKEVETVDDSNDDTPDTDNVGEIDDSDGEGGPDGRKD